MNIDVCKAYNPETFSDFVKGFLPDFCEDVRPLSTDTSQRIIRGRKLGESNQLELTVYELEHTGQSDTRIGLTQDGFRLMKDTGVFNALIAFYSKESNTWRLSLMTTTQELKGDRVVSTFSNPRRFSYLLGSQAKVHTPQKFLLKQGRVSDFEDLKNRFSMEVVNKEFYRHISELFTQLVGGTVAKGKQTVHHDALIKLSSCPEISQTSAEFAVRLIGRILFCWFLREKKSDKGRSLMPHDLLSLESAQRTPDYYHTILEPIFFEVLNKPMPSRKQAYTQEPFSAIPYLNGGLFSPHSDDFYDDDAGNQSINHNTVTIPDEWLCSLFAVLETYNFTIDENTGFDEELSIDPEMLGRIFENLLAEINPETGESARKSTGSYYTPRVIVEYMIEESLLLYLSSTTHIDEAKLRALMTYTLQDEARHVPTDDEQNLIVDALEQVKILDPACGSGAFPMGALQKIVFILQQVDPEGRAWFNRHIRSTPPELRKMIEREFSHKNFDYLRKLGIIRENMYGVDIQPIATEISRLRCFLTLVVDQHIDEDASNRGIEPLPNLDFKFVTANTLIGLPQSQKIGQDGLFEDTAGIQELKDLRDAFFNASGEEREALKRHFQHTQQRMFQQLIDTDLAGQAVLTTHLSTWDPFNHTPSPWFDPSWMFGIKDGFDIVIGNPPYVGFHGIKAIRGKLIENYQSARGKFDLYLIFVEKGLQLVKNKAFFVYICPTNFMKRDHGESLRDIIISNSKIIEIVDFGHNQMFNSATNYTGIFLFQKSVVKDGHILRYKRDLNDKSPIYVQQTRINKQAWVFRPNHFDPIIEKVEKNQKLSEISQSISEGIVTGFNELYLLSIEEIESKGFELTYFKKCLRGKEIKRNKVSSGGFYLFYPYILQESIMTVVDEKTFKQISPNYYHFLESNKENILKREYFRVSHKAWYELWNPRNIDNFSREKIITAELSDMNNFAIADSECLYGDTICGITLNVNSQISLISLTAILNSKLIEFYYKTTTVPKAGGFYIYKVMFLKNIPIVIPDKLIANQIDSLQKQLSNANILNHSRLEREIDQMVYELYELTPEEIAIVEGSVAAR